MTHVEERWALMVDDFLVGRFCWEGGKRDDQNVRTFKTRAIARQARKGLSSYRSEARPVKVRVTVETLDSSGETF